MSGEAPPGLVHPSTTQDKASLKRKASDTKVQLEIKPRIGFRKSRGQAQKLLADTRSSQRKRKAEEKAKPPKKKAKAPTKPGNVIGAVREFSSGWQVRTAEGTILEKVFTSKKKAEDVLRSLQKGETKAEDYLKTSKDKKDDPPSKIAISIWRPGSEKAVSSEKTVNRSSEKMSKKSKKKSKRKEKSANLDDPLDDSIGKGDPAQMKKRREKLLKWKQERLEQSIRKNVQNVDLDVLMQEMEPLEESSPKPKSPEKPSRSASPRKTTLSEEKTTRRPKSSANQPEKEPLFKPKPRSTKPRDRGRRRRRDRDREKKRSRRRDRRSERKRRVRGSESEDDEQRETKKTRFAGPSKKSESAKKSETASENKAAIPAVVTDSNPVKLAGDGTPIIEKPAAAKADETIEKETPKPTEPEAAKVSKERRSNSRSPSPPFPEEFAFAGWIPERDGTRDVDKCYKRLNTISEGVYGVVHRCVDRETQEKVALKKIKLYKTQSGFPLSSLREIGILLDLDHPNIVKVREVVVSETTADVFMVMEYAHNCMQDLIKTAKIDFTTGQVKTLMKDLLTGLAFMHKKWYLHRDLKTANLLYTNDGYLKICDYGMARQYGMPLAPYTNLVVTPWYRAPELLLGCEIYGAAIDVWSCGCIFAEIFMKKVLFHGKGELNQIELIFELLGTPTEEIWPKVSELPHWGKFNLQEYPGKFDDIFVVKKVGNFELTETGKDFLHKLLFLHPEKRLTAEEALNHAWFTEEPLPTPHEDMPKFSEQGVEQKSASESAGSRFESAPVPAEAK